MLFLAAEIIMLMAMNSGVSSSIAKYCRNLDSRPLRIWRSTPASLASLAPLLSLALEGKFCSLPWAAGSSDFQNIQQM